MRLRSFCHRPTGYKSGVSFRAAFIPRRARLLHVHFFARQSMYVGRARLRDNSRAVASSLHVSDARVPARAVRTDCSRTAKNGNYCAALYGDFCPSPRNCLIAASSRNGKNSTLTQQAQTGGIYPATILLLCNGVAMARTTAERQAAYRKNRATAGDNGERQINVWVSTLHYA